MDNLLVSVVIPAFNEENSIGAVLEDIHMTLEKMDLKYEVIVINDGSTDRTVEVAKDYDVTLINCEKNRGKGAALINGFLRAKGQYIVTMDADGSHRSEDLPKLLDPVLKDNSIEAVIGVRFNSDEGKNSTSRLHLIGNRIINTVILFLTGRYVSDSQAGFRVYKKAALKRMAINSERYEIESELTVRILKEGFKVIEIPINCLKRNSGKSKVNSFGDGFKILEAILKASFLS